MTEMPEPDELAFLITTRILAGYVGDSPDLPGGTGEGDWLSIVEFVMPVERAEWEFTFIQNDASAFTQTSMITVENVTANQTLVSTAEPLSFLGELRSDVGDVIRVTSEYAAAGTTPRTSSDASRAAPSCSLR